MSEKWTIYYNPKCGTCRNTLEILKEKGIEPRLVEYLKTPPSLAELKEIARKLGSQWPDMVRTKEPVFAEEKLHLSMPQGTLLKAIAENPELLQRPIVVRGDRAVVARPPEKVEEL